MLAKSSDASLQAGRDLARANDRAASGDHFSGIGVPRSIGTAVTLFFGEPSISRSE